MRILGFDLEVSFKFDFSNAVEAFGDFVAALLDKVSEALGFRRRRDLIEKLADTRARPTWSEVEATARASVERAARSVKFSSLLNEGCGCFTGIIELLTLATNELGAVASRSAEIAFEAESAAAANSSLELTVRSVVDEGSLGVSRAALDRIGLDSVDLNAFIASIDLSARLKASSLVNEVQTSAAKNAESAAVKASAAASGWNNEWLGKLGSNLTEHDIPACTNELQCAGFVDCATAALDWLETELARADGGNICSEVPTAEGCSLISAGRKAALSDARLALTVTRAAINSSVAGVGSAPIASTVLSDAVLKLVDAADAGGLFCKNTTRHSLDINNSPPSLTVLGPVNISEDADAGAILHPAAGKATVLVSASDPDQIDAGQLRFNLRGGDGFFTIDQHTGIVTVAEEGLDASIIPLYLMTVMVVDLAGHSASAPLEVTVLPALDIPFGFIAASKDDAYYNISTIPASNKPQSNNLTYVVSIGGAITKPLSSGDLLFQLSTAGHPPTAKVIFSAEWVGNSAMLFSVTRQGWVVAMASVPRGSYEVAVKAISSFGITAVATVRVQVDVGLSVTATAGVSVAAVVVPILVILLAVVLLIVVRRRRESSRKGVLSSLGPGRSGALAKGASVGTLVRDTERSMVMMLNPSFDDNQIDHQGSVHTVTTETGDVFKVPLEHEGMTSLSTTDTILVAPNPSASGQEDGPASAVTESNPVESGDGTRIYNISANNCGPPKYTLATARAFSPDYDLASAESAGRIFSGAMANASSDSKDEGYLDVGGMSAEA